jgi:hypothetical protein
VGLRSVIGKIYALEFKDSFSDLTWTGLPWVLGNGAPKVLTDPAADVPQRFYRVQQR